MPRSEPHGPENPTPSPADDGRDHGAAAHSAGDGDQGGFVPAGTPADQWFGDGALPPPPPYAVGGAPAPAFPAFPPGPESGPQPAAPEWPPPAPDPAPEQQVAPPAEQPAAPQDGPAPAASPALPADPESGAPAAANGSSPAGAPPQGWEPPAEAWAPAPAAPPAGAEPPQPGPQQQAPQGPPSGPQAPPPGPPGTWPPAAPAQGGGQPGRPPSGPQAAPYAPVPEAGRQPAAPEPQQPPGPSAPEPVQPPHPAPPRRDDVPEPEMLPPLAEAPDDGAIDDAEPQTVRLAPRRGPAGAGPSAPEPAAQEPPEPAPLPEADEAGESTVRLNPGGAGAPAAGSAAPAGPALPGADGADPGDETVRLGPGPAPAGAAPGGTDEFEGTVPVRPGGRTGTDRGAAPPAAQQAPAPQRGPGAPEQAGGHAPPSGGAPAEHQWGQLTGGHQSLLHSAPPAPVRPQPQPQPQGQGQQPPQGHPAAPQPAPPQPDPQAAAWGPPAQTGQQPPAAPYSAGPAQQQPAPPQHPSQPNAGFAPPQGQQGQQGPPPYGAPAQPGAPYGAPPYGQPQQYGPAGYGPQPYEQPPIQAGPEELDTSALVRGGGKKSKPRGGWRKAVHAASLGLVSPGESAADKRRNELVGRARTHVAGGHHRVAVLSLKGGVGKTTTTVALGSMLASLRGDRVLAVDANPDRGTLSDKVRLETAATIRDLLNEQHAITRYADIRGFTSQAASRLEILASDRDPAVSEAFSESDYREVTRLLEHYYSICLTDCGTGLLHSAMRGVLGLADQVVLVSSPSVDGARSASATLDWLEAHEYGYLVRGAVVVLSMVRSSGKSSVDLDRLEQHFAGRCRAVVRVPWDPHLEEGAEVDLERLATSTRDAYLRLSATVGEAFAWPR